MSEFTGVGLGVKTPDVMAKLSSLLSVRQQQQQLRSATAEAAGAEQSQNQRAALADYMKNKLPTKVLEDGTIDLTGISSDPELLAAAGDKAQEVLQGMASIKAYQVDAKSKLWELDETKRHGVAQVAASLLTDPDVAAGPDDPDAKDKTVRGKQKLNDALEQFYESHGNDKSLLPAIAAYSHVIKNASPGGLRNVLTTMRASALTPDQQIGAQTPHLMSTGDALTNINPSAVPTNDIKIGLPPGVYTDANGAQFKVDNNGHRVSELGGTSPNAAPNAVPSAAPEPRRFVQPVPQQKELEEHISQTRKADSDYGQNRHVNEEILRLSQDTSTGPGSSVWHTGAIGKITGTFGGNAAADYQKIGAYLDRQAAMAGQQMGLPETNAGLQTAANLSGTTEYTPDALHTKVTLTDAMVEGAHQYRQGMDRVIGTGPNQDLTKLNEFRNQWANNFDPNIYRAENAIKRGDKKELAAIKDEVGSRGMAELKTKRDNLHKLEAGELLK